ncbi:MAG: phenylalanine--tRNA ligase subunit beta [Gammaproteobacteria bacterium]|nr:phenylalanine--tRNA ligase subunit beta [Gammaproteobacteria bacterium]
MRACVSWLKQWVEPGNVEKLAEQLTLAGLEVARVEPAGALSDHANVVIGRIISCAEHPNAERLRICEVDIGGDDRLSIVCGAPNARKGLVTACAQAGAVLPNMQVEAASIRGSESQGMLCSAMELGLDTDSEGIIEFDHDAPVGLGVVEYLKLSEPVIEFELTPNRGDCLSMLGIAREVAEIHGLAAQPLPINRAAEDIDDVLPVDVVATRECPRYVGRVLKGVNYSRKTPDWIVERLRRSGMRSINPVVDVTNYVMHELGQPMHAFDKTKIRGGVCVRMAAQDERLRLLDGKEVKLDADYLVIADHGHAIALAGIMGGADTAITNESETIFLESAFFSPDAIRGKARELGMQTDASYRFERGVDTDIQVKAMEMASDLIMGIAGGSAGPLVDVASEQDLPRHDRIMLKPSDLERVLGDSINPNMTESILRNLGFTVELTREGWLTTAPSWRFDIQNAYDLVEEVGRCFGFDAIQPRVRTFLPGIKDKEETSIPVHDVKLRMQALGYHEAVTYSFVDPAVQDRLIPGQSSAIKIKNPIAENMSVMRKSLWPGLLEAVGNNVSRQEKRVRLFEVGTVFEAGQKGSQDHHETRMLSAVVCGPVKPRQWAATETPVDFFDLKGDLISAFSLTRDSSSLIFKPSDRPVFQPGQGAEILIGGQLIGLMGKLHPAHARQFDIEADLFMLEVVMQHLLHAELPRFVDVSHYPPVHRDLALVVEEQVEVQFIEDQIKSSAGSLLKNVILFDVFRGGNLSRNAKSMAFGLTFQSNLGNLTAHEIDDLIGKIIRDLKARINVKLRE